MFIPEFAWHVITRVNARKVSPEPELEETFFQTAESVANVRYTSACRVWQKLLISDRQF